MRARVNDGPGNRGGRVSGSQRARFEVIGPDNWQPAAMADHALGSAAAAARAVGNVGVTTAGRGIAGVGGAFVVVTAVHRNVGTRPGRGIAAIGGACAVVLTLERVGALVVGVADFVTAGIAVVAVGGGGASRTISRIVDVKREVLIRQIRVARDAVGHQVVGDDLDREVNRG